MMNHKTNPQTLAQCNATPFNQVGKRIVQVYAVLVATFLIPMSANAALSDWVTNIGEEFKAAVPIIVFILGAIGICMAGFGILSAVGAKKNRQPLEYQHWVIIGGVLCVLLIPFVLALGESISGQSAQNSINGVLG